MRSPLGLLKDLLRLETTEMTAFVILCFSSYVSDFLQHHPDVLEPDLAQVKARVRLTLTHPPVRWLWTQKTVNTRRVWRQDEHAAAFVLRVLEYLYMWGNCHKDWYTEFVVDQIHQRLCILQSLFLGNGTWVGDQTLQNELGTALEDAMEIVNPNPSSAFYVYH
ncbi:hypothetical protein P885DRAFT_40727 [Corynascus similis CBS 632.67]